MNNSRLLEVLKLVSDGDMTADRAVSELSLTAPTTDLGFATVDHDRADRIGFPEVIYGLHKNPSDTAVIATRIYQRSNVVLVTKSSEEAFELFQKSVPEAVWEEGPQAIWADRRPSKSGIPGIAVIAAGTSDLPVAARRGRLTASPVSRPLLALNESVAQRPSTGFAGFFPSN